MLENDLKDLLFSLNPGDLVKLSKGDTALIGRVERKNGEPFLNSFPTPVRIYSYIRSGGYVLSVLHRTETTVPVVPGLYAADHEDGGGPLYLRLYLWGRDEDSELRWAVMGENGLYAHRELPSDYLPLRLVELALEA